MSLNVTQSNNNLTLQVFQSNVKATLSVTQNINELHITAIQNNEITKLQPIVNTNSSDFTETDPIFQASEASLFVVGDKANLDNQSGINTGDETILSIQTKRPIKTVNGESLEGSGNVQIDYNDLNNLPTIISNHSGLNLDDGTNPHGTTKQDVGLGNVPNLNTTDAVNKAHEHSNISVLNGTEESFTTALKNAYNSAVSWITTNGTNLINHLTNTSNPHNVTKSQVGLSSVDNTSDVDKPISTATQVALNLKLDKVSTAGVERVYTINTDGSQGIKSTSDFKDVLEFTNLAAFPATGETSKIYVALDTNFTYRWSGSAYVQIWGSEKQIFFTPGAKYDLNAISSCFSTNVETGFASALINQSAGNMPNAMGIKWVLPLFISEKNQKLKKVNIRITYATFTTLRLVIFTGLSVNNSNLRINNQIIHDQNYTLNGNISLHKITSFTNDVTIPIGYDLCFFLIRVDGTTGTLNNFQISGYAS